MNEFKLEQITGKFSQEDEDKDVDDEEFSSSDLNKTVLNKSASLLEISPLKNVSKRDKLEYGKQKVKKLETSMTNLVASALDIDPKEISEK